MSPDSPEPYVGLASGALDFVDSEVIQRAVLGFRGHNEGHQ